MLVFEVVGIKVLTSLEDERVVSMSNVDLTRMRDSEESAVPMGEKEVRSSVMFVLIDACRVKLLFSS